MQLKWSFGESGVTNEYYFQKLPGVEEALTRRETLLVLPDTEALAVGTSYDVKLDCIDSNNNSASSVLVLSVNAPPRGAACRACRWLGTACATTQPHAGVPIFDIFRLACENWADEDGPLEYQFAYSNDASQNELRFDWGSNPSMDFILPPGKIILKVRVRDGLGASTAWMDSEEIEVAPPPLRRPGVVECLLAWTGGQRPWGGCARL